MEARKRQTWIKEQNVIYTYAEILFKPYRGRKFAICNHMDESRAPMPHKINQSRMDKYCIIPNLYERERCHKDKIQC